MSGEVFGHARLCNTLLLLGGALVGRGRGRLGKEEEADWGERKEGVVGVRGRKGWLGQEEGRVGWVRGGRVGYGWSI